MPTERFAGVVLANELLDNLPFRLLVHDGRWREAFVGRSGDALTEVLRPADDLADVPLPPSAAHGARMPVPQAARDWVGSTRQLVTRGRLVAIDYGVPTAASLSARPWREWLRTYRDHQRGVHYLREPGSQDITCDVAWDVVGLGSPPDEMTTQADFLRSLGIEELVDQGRGYWEQHAAAPDLHALRMRSRVSEALALLDPSGLGGFAVHQWIALTGRKDN